MPDAWFADGALVEALGWTILHFLWQGMALAALYALLAQSASFRTAHKRYWLGCAILVVCLVLPVVTFFVVQEHGGVGAAFVSGAEDGITRAAAAGAGADQVRALLESPTLIDVIRGYTPAVVMAWGVGVAIFGARLLGGWCWLQHLRFAHVRPVEERWRRRLEELAVEMRVLRPVWLLESSIVRVPTLVGWIRPVILLPTSAFLGLTPEQLEAVLAHELAHVRRHDYIVNLVQSVVEVLLFYHPAVWWISQRVRDERENCCDDMAVEAAGDPLVLGRALLVLGKLARGSAPQPALAATGGVLFGRVKRLLVPGPVESASRTPLPVAALLVLLAAAIALPGAGSADKRGADSAAWKSANPTVAEHAHYEAGRTRITLHEADISLADACARMTELSGMRFTLPSDAASQRVHVSFDNVPADMAMISLFNLLQMDHFVGEDGRVTGEWWPDVAARTDWVPFITVENFHRRQEVFRQLAHSIGWTRGEVRTLGEALEYITQTCGVRFELDESLRGLPAPDAMDAATARAALHALLKPHGLRYEYSDESEIVISR